MMKKKAGWLVVAVWLCSVMTGLWIYGGNQTSEFDPQLSLTAASSERDFDTRFAAYLNEAGIRPGTLVHLQTDSPCFCNSLSRQHQYDLSELLKEQGYSLTVVNLSDHPSLADNVPSFPALAVLDAENQLRYLGAYATGLGCYTGDDLVATIANWVKQDNYQGAMINADGEGCYCPTSDA
mgnify:CR=1 FL=1